MEKEIELTILIPALNEEKTIGIVIDKAQRWLEKNKINGEILISNNASTDNTKNVSLDYGCRVIDVPQRGYGNALILGILEAYGEYVIMGDADDSYNFLEIDNIYKELKDGQDLVIGNRLDNIEKGAMKLTHRYIGTPLIGYLIKRKFNIDIKDVNSGLRGFNRKKILDLNLKCEGMEFASEMVIKAKKHNLNIKEVKINFYKDKRNRRSHLNPIKDGIRHIKLIIKEKSKSY